MFALLMGIKTVAPKDLLKLAQNGSAVVIDVNAARHWAQQHVPRALNLEHEKFTEQDLPSDRNAMLVFYCSGPMCRKAPKAARRAERMGYQNVRVMSAGISGWVAAGLPVEQGTERNAQ